MAADKTPERIALEARAEELGIRFAWNTGDDTLAERIAEAETTADTQDTPPSDEGAEAGNTPDTSAPDAEAAGDTQDNPPSEGAKVRVVGPKKGRWRAGRFFTREGVVLAVDELTDAELAAIADDPKLEVTWLADEED